MLPETPNHELIRGLLREPRSVVVMWSLAWPLALSISYSYAAGSVPAWPQAAGVPVSETLLTISLSGTVFELPLQIITPARTRPASDEQKRGIVQ